MKDIEIIELGRVRISLAWYDIWIGAFIDSTKNKLYICPLPFLLITVRYLKSLNSENTESVSSTSHEAGVYTKLDSERVATDDSTKPSKVDVDGTLDSKSEDGNVCWRCGGRGYNMIRNEFSTCHVCYGKKYM